MFFEKTVAHLFPQFYNFLHCLGHWILKVKQTPHIRRCEFLLEFSDLPLRSKKEQIESGEDQSQPDNLVYLQLNSVQDYRR